MDQSLATPPARSAPSPFFQGNPYLQFAWDQTSMGLLMECPYKYQQSILFGYRQKGVGLHLTFGKHFADAMERYHKLSADGFSHDDALSEVVSKAMYDTWEYDEDGTGGQPWDSGDTKKNRFTLIRSIVWYFETYKDDAMKTVILADGRPGVELLFSFGSGLYCSHGEFLFTGHIDRLVDFDGTTFVLDNKTTGAALGSYYFRQYDTDNQMSQYTYAGRICYNAPVAGVVIDACQVLVGSTTFARGITTRSQSQLDEWAGNAEQWLTLAEVWAERLVRDPNYQYPKNLKSCGNYGGCAFREVCGATPEVRQHFLETYFEKRFWNPLEIR